VQRGCVLCVSLKVLHHSRFRSVSLVVVAVERNSYCRIRWRRLLWYPVVRLAIVLLNRRQPLAIRRAERQSVRVANFALYLVSDQLIVTEASRVLAAPLLQCGPVFALAVLANASMRTVCGIDRNIPRSIISCTHQILADVVQAVYQVLCRIALLDAVTIFQIRSV
jgi:hypothetical protein